jgi:anti-sigma regulatory factor (Ser/Thr protein kinase)
VWGLVEGARIAVQVFSRTFGIKGKDFGKGGGASLEIREILRDVGIDPQIIRRAAIATYEAEMNMVMYASRGRILLELDPEAIRISLDDEGPGIEDIGLAMQEGYSTATEEMREMGFGAGMGLPNINKNADLFELRSTVGVGTYYRIVFYLNPGGRR